MANCRLQPRRVESCRLKPSVNGSGLGTSYEGFFISRTLTEPASRKHFVSREIRIPFCPGRRGPVGQRCWLGQRPTISESLHKIRVADERSSKGDQVGVSLGNRFLCGFLRVAAVAHERPV